LLLLSGTAFAQTGTIAGQVKDASGGALPGVTVEVTSPALIEKVRSSVTGEDGRYQITALPVGTYQVVFTLENFAKVSRANVAVSSDFSANVNADMKVGDLKSTVTVVAEAPVVDVQNARVQQVFSGTEVADLPTTRDVPGLLLLVPSLTVDPGRGVCSGGIGIFCNPTVPTFNSHVATNDPEGGLTQGRVLVDGMVINAGRTGTANTGSANGLTIDTANVQEVSFTLSGSLGESETGGASINIVPRTGGNRFAGNFFTSYLQTKFFDRNRETRLKETPDIQEYNYDYDVNGAFGGPIKRDRLWFYAYAGNRGVDLYPQGGSTPGFKNLNEGRFAANYEPDRANGWLTFRNEYKKAEVRLTLQASQKNKLNAFWSEQSSCTNPCYGMINVVDSPEAYASLQSYPNRLTQLSWTNPFTNRMLFEAGLTYVSTHEDQTQHREFTNYRSIPRVCEVGPTVGRDAEAIKVNTSVGNNWPFGSPAAGQCDIFSTMISGSINAPFPGGQNVLRNDDTYRSKASASYITGAHNAKVGFEGAYFSEKIRNEINDLRLNYHYQTPATTGTWNAQTRSGNCLAAPAGTPYACGNMSLYYPEDPTNTLLRTRPIGFQQNTGLGVSDERVWFGALYLQDQWTLNRFTLNGALRYDHAESRYGTTCIGPDLFVPTQLDGTNYWCSTPAKGVRYNDITPRWGVAWDVFGTGRTAIKWNMGKYLQAATLGGLYINDNAARRSTNSLTRGWDDLNGNRVVECNFNDPAPHTSPAGDFCGSLLDTTGAPSQAFVTFGRPPTAAQLFNPNSNCGRTENSSQLHQDYCAEAGQNLLTGWDKRRNQWQFGLGIQHELLPRLSLEVTYNRTKYSNLTDSDTVLQGCDYFGPRAAEQDYRTCANGYQDYHAELYDFFTIQAPVDPRLPGGGGYTIRGLTNQKAQGALPASGGNVTLIRDDLEYAWNGVDTNFVLRARGGFRVSGGTSTGRAVRNICYTDIDTPNVKGRVGNEYGGGCLPRVPFQTNVRANASYTIPWVDILTSTVFQYRPGSTRSATLTVSNTDVAWEPESQYRSGTLFYNAGANPTATYTGGVNLLDTGDLYGEGLRMWDLKFSKNFRFARKRLNIGVDIFNVFNSDAATGYQNNYTAFRQPDGTYVEDNPATPDIVEANDWGRVTQITTPRHLKLSIQFDF